MYPLSYTSIGFLVTIKFRFSGTGTRGEGFFRHEIVFFSEWNNSEGLRQKFNDTVLLLKKRPRFFVLPGKYYAGFISTSFNARPFSQTAEGFPSTE